MSNLSKKEQLTNANIALVMCNEVLYPAIFKILTVFLIIPVDSVPCRVFSIKASFDMTSYINGLVLLLMNRNSKFITTPGEVYAPKANCGYG